jgi:2-keto-4-pentenoate hydratase/2-oxohepta-3-ene-1,7-dioic acid hydratase in catechol pathway
VGLNYSEHVLHAAAKLGIKADLPKQPDVGYRAANALIAHDEPVVIPRDATKVQYEGELVAAIAARQEPLRGRGPLLRARLHHRQRRQRARWQKSDRTLWRPRTPTPSSPWARGSRPTSTSRRWRRVRVNGQETTRFPTNAMIFGVAAYIAAITRYITLVPGDILWMGTDGTSPDLKAGDTVEVEITGLGILRNRFVDAAQS